MTEKEMTLRELTYITPFGISLFPAIIQNVLPDYLHFCDHGCRRLNFTRPDHAYVFELHLLVFSKSGAAVCVTSVVYV